MKERKLTAYVFLKKKILRQGNKTFTYGFGDFLFANKIIITIIIQIVNQGKQMASVCYHPSYRRQRLQSLWY